MDYLLLILGFLAIVFVFGVAIGGFFLLAACWLVNEMSGKSLRERRKPEEEAPTPVLKTTDAGPYTAPGVESLPEISDPAEKDAAPQMIPVPSYPYACLIAGCVLAAIVGINLGIEFMSFQAARGYVAINPLIAVLFDFFLAVAIHTSMLKTTLLRGFLLTLMLLIPWGVLTVAVIVVCSPR